MYLHTIAQLSCQDASLTRGFSLFLLHLHSVDLHESGLAAIIKLSGGDMRKCLNVLQVRKYICGWLLIVRTRLCVCVCVCCTVSSSVHPLFFTFPTMFIFRCNYVCVCHGDVFVVNEHRRHTCHSGLWTRCRCIVVWATRCLQTLKPSQGCCSTNRCRQRMPVRESVVVVEG